MASSWAFLAQSASNSACLYPRDVRETSLLPAYRFSACQMVSPWRTSTRFVIIGPSYGRTLLHSVGSSPDVQARQSVGYRAQRTIQLSRAEDKSSHECVPYLLLHLTLGDPWKLRG